MPQGILVVILGDYGDVAITAEKGPLNACVCVAVLSYCCNIALSFQLNLL